MSELQVFNNAEFGSVRSFMVSGEPYFAGRDVAKILGYANPNDALTKRVDEEEQGLSEEETLQLKVPNCKPIQLIVDRKR